MHQLLQRLAEQGFAAVPRLLAVNADGTEDLSYLEGVAGNYPLIEEVRSAKALTSAAELLRRFHDASAAFAGEQLQGWLFPARFPVEVVCHGDYAPYNCVFVGEQATGIIDFDCAHPGSRGWDLAYALYRFAPLTHHSNPDGFGTISEQVQRARIFLDAYGWEGGEDLGSLIAARLRTLVAFVRARATAGEPAYLEHVRRGDLALYQRDLNYLLSNADLLREALKE